jgi:hypothetical protein
MFYIYFKDSVAYGNYSKKKNGRCDPLPICYLVFLRVLSALVVFVFFLGTVHP